MMKKIFTGFTFFIWASLSQADEVLKKQLEQMLPGITIERIELIEGTGFYQTVVDGEVLYFSSDGRYVFQGELIEIASRKNLTKNLQSEIKKQLLADLDEDQMIVFSPENPKYTITVFTDIDCGYCRKLHQQINEYNDLGIAVRYLAFPRSGEGSESFNKAVDVWCAEDRKQAMTDSKLGTRIKTEPCENPVASHVESGIAFGIRGTPAIILEDGQLLPGYIPPQRLKQILEQQG